MTSHAGISARHVNTYHQSTSLLFQFILVEFAESYAEIQRLDRLCTRTPAPLPDNEASCRQTEDTQRQIEMSLAKLVGSTRDYMRLFSWNFSEGLVAKLKTYCALFLQNSDSDEKELIALQHYADKIWMGCLQAIDAIHENPQEQAALLAALEKANAAMQRFAKLISRLIQQFREDENVIFYVVRHHQLFDKLYGYRFVFKLLGKIFPKGLRETHQFLIKKYTARGFENLLPAIQVHINEIEAAAQ